MSTSIENTQTIVATSTPHQEASPSTRGKDSGGKRPAHKGQRKPRRNQNTVAYKLLPKSRDVDDIHSAAIVIGRGGKNQKSIEKATGTVLTVLNAKQQRNFKPMEVNTKDAQIMKIEVDTDMTMEDMSYEQRLNRAKQKIAKAIQYWRDIAYPPEDDGGGADADGQAAEHEDEEEHDATLATHSGEGCN